MNKKSSLYVGVMSGTSTDGADIILADFANAMPRVVGFYSVDFPPALREELLALNAAGENELERSNLAANTLAEIYARAITALLARTGTLADEVIATGCHGQTVRHRPDLGFTVQLNSPARLVELTGITTVADFRSRDIAAGGQGAPLVPAFHGGMFRSSDEVRVVVNIGGIANITILDKSKPAWGFDCGPGNCLMDAWIEANLGKRFDENGAWAQQGQVLEGLLSQCLSEKYFEQAPPKSTGRDLFNAGWLAKRLSGNENPVDVQATLLGLTAVSIANDVKRFAPDCEYALVCGGGARNATLMARLAEHLPKLRIATTDAHGVPTQQVEALAFAWLAKQAVEQRALNLCATTGASHAVVLGAIYQK